MVGQLQEGQQQERGHGQGEGQQQEQRQEQQQEQPQGQQEGQQQQQEEEGQQVGQQQQLWGRKGPRVLSAALKYADLRLVEWLVGEAGCPLPEPGDIKACKRLAGAAAGSGSIARLVWLAARGLPVDAEAALGGAAAEGHVEVLQYVLGMGRTDGDLASCTAVAKGHLDIVKFLAAHLDPPNPGAHMIRLLTVWPDVTSGRDEELCAALPWLWDEALDDISVQVAFIYAFQRGHLPLIHVLLGLRPEFIPEVSRFVLMAAADGGCEDVLRWLAERRSAAGATAAGADVGAGGGASGNGVGAGGGGGGDGVLEPWPWGCCSAALANGDLATAAFLCSHGGVAWPPDALAQAVAKGLALSALQWLVAHGAPAGPGEARAALAAAGSSGVREWLCSLQLQEGGAAAGEQQQRQGQEREHLGAKRLERVGVCCAVQ